MSNESDTLRIGVTFLPQTQEAGPTKLKARVSARAIESMTPSTLEVDKALLALKAQGFETTNRGRLTASIRGSRRQFEEVFGTKLSEFTLPGDRLCQFHSFYFPRAEALFEPNTAIAGLIDDAYIQWPHTYMGVDTRTPSVYDKGSDAQGRPSAEAPDLGPGYRLNLQQVAEIIGASHVHAAGTRGKGVKIAMLDSGFDYSHPYFKGKNFRSSVVLAPGASDRSTDRNGHGTGQSANVFAIAPDAEFIGVKLDNDDEPGSGASLLEGFVEAMEHDPDIITISIGHDLRGDDGKPLATLPNSLVALEMEIAAAIARGVVVIAAAGNGDYAFPGQMNEVISAGGVFVRQSGDPVASDLASGFTSSIYSGRSVPDFCGLVGLRPFGAYITLPVPPGSMVDKRTSHRDRTETNDGWAVFSGTSAAAPQLAAVCALLLEKNPNLTPAEIKAVLKLTARDVTVGRANSRSDPRGVGILAGPNDDGATGAGLVDAYKAWQLVAQGSSEVPPSSS